MDDGTELDFDSLLVFYHEGDLIDEIKKEARIQRNFCDEQELVRQIPLRGLKPSERRELTREYCVH